MLALNMIDSLLDEIESDKLIEKQREYSSVIFQPSRLCLSSQNAIPPQDNYNPQTDNSFYNFTIQLPRPINLAKNIQLLRSSIPQCSPNISDSSLVFYYYKLPTQTDINGNTFYTELPNIYNLYMIRLLPSFYKQELISTPSQYGFNQTFSGYQQLLAQLNLACANDLAYNNQVVKTMPFIPSDITFSIINNRFQFTGNNVNTATPINIYSNTNIYNKNNLVLYDSLAYICKVDGTFGVLPVVTAYWAVYTQTNNFYTYLAAGSQDPNVLTLQGNSYNVVWNPYHWYQTGDVTFYKSYRYTALQPNQGQTPANNSIWSQGTSSPVVAQGISGLSQTYDYELLASIPSQPFLAPPLANRTLNTILGFTWNGLSLQLSQLVTPTTYTNGSSAPLLFNRLRPVPIYASGSLLGDYPQTITGTYTADAYCNLVYSSVISIYCDLVSAATLDSQRNNNLLSIVPLNCPNLGVSFYNNTIDNPLTGLSDQISKIYIELRSDDGSPFYISNNGIVTLELKIGY